MQIHVVIVVLYLQAEAPIAIYPLLDKMTASELHAVMSSGFATVSGSVMGLFILWGVSNNILV